MRGGLSSAPLIGEAPREILRKQLYRALKHTSFDAQVAVKLTFAQLGLLPKVRA